MVITIVACVASMISLIVMIAAYVRWRVSLRSAYNDLFVFGLGSLQFMQASHTLVFAVIRLRTLRTDSGDAVVIQPDGTGGGFTVAMCDASAVLDQFFDCASQVLSAGFFFSLLTIRSGGDCTRAGISCTHSLLTRTVWPAAALICGAVTTVVMWAEVRGGGDSGTNTFFMETGWCWIGGGTDTDPLKTLCSYAFSFICTVLAIAAVVSLYRASFGGFAMHRPVFARLLLLLLYIFIAYSVGAVARFGGDQKRVVATYVSCFIFPAWGFCLAFTFIVTEKLAGPIRRSLCGQCNDDERGGVIAVPPDGFSGALGSLLLLGVEGQPYQASEAAQSQRLFYDDDYLNHHRSASADRARTMSVE